MTGERDLEGNELNEGFENPLYEIPTLSFNSAEREVARQEIDSVRGINNDPEDGDSLAGVIELVINQGLFEYYPHIEELWDPRKVYRIINYLARKEDNGIDMSLKIIKLRRLYWENVTYPYVANNIIKDSLDCLSSSELFGIDVYPFSPPSDEQGRIRIGLLSRLVRLYKESTPEDQNSIRKFLESTIADYPS